MALMMEFRFFRIEFVAMRLFLGLRSVMFPGRLECCILSTADRWMAEAGRCIHPGWLWEVKEMDVAVTCNTPFCLTVERGWKRAGIQL